MNLEILVENSRENGMIWKPLNEVLPNHQIPQSLSPLLQKQYANQLIKSLKKKGFEVRKAK